MAWSGSCGRDSAAAASAAERRPTWSTAERCLDDRSGLISCYDARTGKQAYRQRLVGAGGFTASPWGCDGKVFCVDSAGMTFVLKAGPTYKLLGKNTIGEMCWATPAAAGSDLFLRTVDHLYCIRGKE